MIKELIHNSKKYVNVPLDVEGLMSLGMLETEANALIQQETLRNKKESGKKAIKQGHSNALLSLTEEPTRAEADTWPSKTRYAIQNKLACMAKTGKGEQPEDGEGLTAKQRANVQMALLPGETINGYLGAVFNRVEQFEELAFFAEGFKRKTQKAFADAEPENKQTVLKQAEAEMVLALGAFREKLASQG